MWALGLVLVLVGVEEAGALGLVLVRLLVGESVEWLARDAGRAPREGPRWGARADGATAALPPPPTAPLPSAGHSVADARSGTARPLSIPCSPCLFPLSTYDGRMDAPRMEGIKKRGIPLKAQSGRPRGRRARPKGGGGMDLWRAGSGWRGRGSRQAGSCWPWRLLRRPGPTNAHLTVPGALPSPSPAHAQTRITLIAAT